jgi:hypothetical protein
VPTSLSHERPAPNFRVRRLLGTSTRSSSSLVRDRLPLHAWLPNPVSSSSLAVSRAALRVTTSAPNETSLVAVLAGGSRTLAPRKSRARCSAPWRRGRCRCRAGRRIGIRDYFCGASAGVRWRCALIQVSAVRGEHALVVRRSHLGLLRRWRGRFIAWRGRLMAWRGRDAGTERARASSAGKDEDEHPGEDEEHHSAHHAARNGANGHATSVTRLSA